MSMCARFTLRYSRNYHNIIKQLHSTLKKKKRLHCKLVQNAINHLIAEDKWIYLLRESNAYFLYYISDDSKEKLSGFKFHFYHFLTMQSRVSNPSVPY